MLVSIKNNNTRVYREEYKEKLIEIPAGEHISMERRDAINFLGSIPKTDSDTGQPIIKKLQMVTYIEEPQEQVEEIKCTLCGKVCATETGLKVHLKSHSR